MTDRRRTRIRRLSITGYRSIREQTLDHLPDIVVLHGPNGAGKSNVLRAAELVLRWASREGDLPTERAASVAYPYVAAADAFGLRAEDFHAGAPKEIRIALDLELGARARAFIGSDEVSVIHLEAVAQDTGEGIRVWFEKADIDGTIKLAGNDANALSLRTNIANHRAAIQSFEGQIREWQAQMKTAALAARLQLESQVRNSVQARENVLRALIELQKALSTGDLIAERARSSFLRNGVLRYLEAYRQVQPELLQSTASPGLQTTISRALSSPDGDVSRAMRRLPGRMADAGLLPHTRPIELRAVEDPVFGEHRLYFRIGADREVPLANLGTGEQQLVLMIANTFVGACPIVMMEEPEAHLHKLLMEPLARFLLANVGSPDHDIEQLWLATHHHLFALAPDFYDVALEGGETKIQKKPKAKNAVHFYEPGPLWDALDALVTDGMLRDDAIILRDEDGKAIRASQVRASMEGDGILASKFTDALTARMVMAMKSSAERGH